MRTIRMIVKGKSFPAELSVNIINSAFIPVATHSLIVATKSVPAHEAWYRTMPFAAYVFFMLLADVLAWLVWNAQELRWLYAIKIAAVVVLLWKFWGRYTELLTPTRGNYPHLVNGPADWRGGIWSLD